MPKKKRGNGEGSIFYSEKRQKWIAQVVVGYKPDGTPKRKTILGNTRKEANDKLSEILSSIKDDSFVEKNDITLIELIEEITNDELNANKITE